MATDKNNDLKKLVKMKEKALERQKDLNAKAVPFTITMSFKPHEIRHIKYMTKLILKKHGVKRSELLRKVLLNLDDDELIDFLNLRKKI